MDKSTGIIGSLLGFTYILGIILKAIGIPALTSVSWFAVLAWYPIFVVVMLVVCFGLIATAAYLAGK